LEASIALLQTEQPIDWPQIVAIHDSLAKLTPSPVAELNRAVAIAEAGSPSQALRIVDQLSLDDYQYLHSTRAELLRRLGRNEEARDAYQRALTLTQAEPERQFLKRRLAEI
jgi:RNA polymerase sigma-70 factor (ECF subfamily)